MLYKLLGWLFNYDPYCWSDLHERIDAREYIRYWYSAMLSADIMEIKYKETKYTDYGGGCVGVEVEIYTGWSNINDPSLFKLVENMSKNGQEGTIIIPPFNNNS